MFSRIAEDSRINPERSALIQDVTEVILHNPCWRTREFQRGDASADELQQVVDEVLAELDAPDGEARRAAQAAGIDTADLAGVEVRVAEGQQGAEPVLTTILVGILVSAGSKVAESLWKDVIWPRIRKRLGWTAVKEEVQSTTEGGA